MEPVGMALRDLPTMLGFTWVGGMGLTGCWAPELPTDSQYASGLVWMFPGVEGGPWQLEQASRALRDAGVESAIRVHDWRRPLASVRNLADYEHNRREAAKIADQISNYRRTHPHAQVSLVGYSGGGGLAIMVAEALPDGVTIRDLVLCQAAISPDYDLTPALRHINGEIVNLHSPRDWLILGLGTKLLGTMDRHHVASAGKDGFDLAAAVADPAMRQRVKQVAWCPNMRQFGHDGGHLGILAYEWNKHNVAPLLLAPQVAHGQ